jgi:hypothetical protein
VLVRLLGLFHVIVERNEAKFKVIVPFPHFDLLLVPSLRVVTKGDGETEGMAGRAAHDDFSLHFTVGKTGKSVAGPGYFSATA